MKSLVEFIKESIGENIKEVKFTNSLKNHPVCLASEGDLSIGMEQVLNKMPGNDMMGPVKAQAILEININHKIAEKLKTLYIFHHSLMI